MMSTAQAGCPKQCPTHMPTALPTDDARTDGRTDLRRTLGYVGLESHVSNAREQAKIQLPMAVHRG